MGLEERLTALESAFAALTAKQMATEAALGTLANFIGRDPLLTERLLELACETEAGAMQEDGSAPLLLPVFREEIASWQSRLRASEEFHRLAGRPTGT